MMRRRHSFVISRTDFALDTPTKRYLVVGRAGMDLAPEPAGTAIEDAHMLVATLGGSAANIAVGLTRLGSPAALLTAVSADPVGDYCINQLKAFGVDTAHVTRRGGESRTSLALTEARVEGHRTVIYRNGAADLALDAEAVGGADCNGFSCVVITGTALAAEPSRSAVLGLMARAEAAGVQCVLDIDYRPYSWASAQEAAMVLQEAARRCRIIVGNDEEFDVLAGAKGAGLDHARSLGKAPHHVAIYKRGALGSICIQPGGEFATGIWPATPLKPTGAGDSFLAAFLSGYNGGLETGEAILRGAAAAAIVVSRPGCAPAMPGAPELDAFMAANRHLVTRPETA